MLGVDDGPLQACGHEGDECLACSPEGHERHLRAELVLTYRVGDRLDDLLDRTVEQLRGGALGCRLQPRGERRERGQRRLAAGERIGAFVDQSEGVRSAGGGERVERPAGAHAGVRLWIAVAWSDELELCARELFRLGEAGVRQAGDVGAARARRRERTALQESHAASGGPDDPAVDRADARGTAHHPERAHHRAAALDDRDVRARAAALDDDRVGQTELVQRSGHPRRRPGADREARAGLRNASTLMAPPSPRSTSSGTSRPDSFSASSTTAAVRSTTGRMLAFTAALTVRISSPYAPLRSWPTHTGSPCA